MLYSELQELTVGLSLGLPGAVSPLISLYVHGPRTVRRTERFFPSSATSLAAKYISRRSTYWALSPLFRVCVLLYFAKRRHDWQSRCFDCISTSSSPKCAVFRVAGTHSSMKQSVYWITCEFQFQSLTRPACSSPLPPARASTSCMSRLHYRSPPLWHQLQYLSTNYTNYLNYQL